MIEGERLRKTALNEVDSGSFLRALRQKKQDQREKDQGLFGRVGQALREVQNGMGQVLRG